MCAYLNVIDLHDNLLTSPFPSNWASSSGSPPLMPLITGFSGPYRLLCPTGPALCPASTLPLRLPSSAHQDQGPVCFGHCWDWTREWPCQPRPQLQWSLHMVESHGAQDGSG
ncbi:hypothetical protein AHAS_Ahas02G0080000 [Arachis hypogaea]